MHKETQNIIAQHILNDLQKYSVVTMDAIGLLECIKLSLYDESIKKKG